VAISNERQAIQDGATWMWIRGHQPTTLPSSTGSG
jgi:hypothetical protein